MHFLAIKRVETRLFTVFLLYQDENLLCFFLFAVLLFEPLLWHKIAAHFRSFYIHVSFLVA